MVRFVEVIVQRNGDRVGLLPRGAARDPYSDRIAIGPVLNQAREDKSIEILEGFRVAEELGDADQEVSLKSGELPRILFNLLAVFFEAAKVMQCEPPHDAAADHVLPIEAEIDVGRIAQ